MVNDGKKGLNDIKEESKKMKLLYILGASSDYNIYLDISSEEGK
jgi:hypothetical protein